MWNKSKVFHSILLIDRWSDRKNQSITENISAILYQVQRKELGLTIANNTINI